MSEVPLRHGIFLPPFHPMQRSAAVQAMLDRHEAEQRTARAAAAAARPPKGREVR